MTSMREYVEEAFGVLERMNKVDGLLWTGGKEAMVLSHMLTERMDKDITHVVLHTGNHFYNIESFRNEYTSYNDIEVEVWQHKEMLDEVIRNPFDPRGYHGAHRGYWLCPSCGAEIDSPENEVLECGDCGTEYGVSQNFTEDVSKEDWGVAESCGRLKTETLKMAIRDGDYKTLVTGMRSDDPLISESDKDMGVEVEYRSPARHTRINPLASWSEEHVWAYIKKEFVPYPTLYNEGYRHTDSICCTGDSKADEYGDSGRDKEKMERMEDLEDMGYI